MVHDLLRHTSGLAYDFVATGAVQKIYVEAGLRRRNRSNEDFCQTLAKLPLYRQPGTSWDYSVSTDVLAAWSRSCPAGRWARLCAKKYWRRSA